MSSTDADTDAATPPPEVSDAQRATLVAVLREVFPHDAFPEGPYERTADGVLAAVTGSVWSTMTLLNGLDSIKALAAGDFRALDEADTGRILQHVAGTPFFDLIRATAVVALYDDEEVWALLGYEGASVDKGGYIDRGFNDLDWLPEPRIEEYDGPEQLLEVATAGTGAGAQATVGASHPGRATSRVTSTNPVTEATQGEHS